MAFGYKDLRGKWTATKDENKRIREEGRCVIRRRVRTGTAYRINVVCSFDPVFAAGARQLAGRWRDKTGVWSFESYQFESVEALCIRVFGKKGVEIL